MKNILDIIYDYSKKYKLLDEDAINKILDELFKLYQFVDYSYEVVTKKNVLNSDLGDLVGNDMTIYLYNLRKKINDNDYPIESDLESKLPLFEGYLRMNCEMLLTCLHECEHCIQNNLMSEPISNDDTLEKKLIRVEDTYLRKVEGSFLFIDSIDKILKFVPSFYKYEKSKRRYERNYDISIMERLANIHSFEKIKDMLKEIENELTVLLELMDQIIFAEKMGNYTTKWGPTLLFFDELGYYDEVDRYEGINYSFEDRFTYGLNLTDDEFEDNIEKVQSFKKSRTI